MAETIKLLAQSNPSATTLTSVYTCGASGGAVISTVTICNQGVAGTFRLSVSDAGAGDDPKQYLYHDLPIPVDDTFALTFGVTLENTDILKVYCSHANMSINVFGTEIT